MATTSDEVILVSDVVIEVYTDVVSWCWGVLRSTAVYCSLIAWDVDETSASVDGCAAECGIYV